MDYKKYGYIALVTYLGNEPISFLFEDVDEYQEALNICREQGFEIVEYYWGLDTYNSKRFIAVADFYARKKTKDSNVVQLVDWQPQDEGC